jgi:hypothetical protein
MPYQNKTIKAGITRSTFYTWLNPHKVIRTESGYEFTPAEFIKLKARLTKLEQELEVLKKNKMYRIITTKGEIKRVRTVLWPIQCSHFV